MSSAVPRNAIYGCVTVTVYVTGAVCWPTSRIWTHSVPAVVRPVICGVEPATTFDDAPASGVQPASPGVPSARPITTAGEAAVRSTSVEPVFDTGKLWNTEPPTGTVPENVSVVRVVLGAATVPLVLLLLHAAAVSAATAISATTAGLMSAGR